MGIYQGTVIRDQIQKRLTGEQSNDASFLLQNGNDNEDEQYYYYEGDDSDEYLEEYFDDDELNPLNNGKDQIKK